MSAGWVSHFAIVFATPGQSIQTAMNEHKLKLKTELIRHGIQQKDVAQRAGASNTSVHAFLYETVRMSEELQTDILNAIFLLLEEAKRGSGSVNR